MNLMYQEIYEQSYLLRSIKSKIEPIIDEISRSYYENKPYNIVVAARGSSDNASHYFKYLAEVYLGISVTLAAPSVITLYNGHIDYSHSIVIGVSQSGQAQDVLEILKMAKTQNARVISITNDQYSPMAQIADYHLDLNVGKEKSVAATKTFMAEMYVFALLVAKLSYNNELCNMLDTVPSRIESIYSMESKIFDTSKSYTNVNECYILSRGYLYSIALESALKIQETCYINAKAYSVSDFHHGPFAVVDENSHIILLMNSGKTYKDTYDMARKIKGTNAHLTIITDKNDVDLVSDELIVVPNIHEVVSPFIYIFIMQLFAWKVSINRGNNPDEPRGLNKITITK